MKYFILVILVFLIAGCTDEPVAPKYNSAFFPLQQGNWWKYSGTYDMELEVKGINSIQGKNYYVVERRYTDLTDTLLLRYESEDKLMIFFQGEEFLYIDFSLPESSTWDSYYNFYGQIRKKGLFSSVTAGYFTNVTEVLFDNRIISDVYEFNHYAPGAGLISSTGFRRAVQLDSAGVNGKTYP